MRVTMRSTNVDVELAALTLFAPRQQYPRPMTTMLTRAVNETIVAIMIIAVTALIGLLPGVVAETWIEHIVMC